MTPSIDLTDDLFTRLQKHAVPLVDTPLTVIARALDALEAGDEEPSSQAASPAGPRSFNPAAAPNLSHTTPRRAQVADKALPKNQTYWNPIMFAVITEAAKKGVSTEDLLDLLTIPSVKGKKEDSGYRYLQEAGLSVQGQDANSAWKQTYRIASSVGVPVQVVFVWQDNPKAAMPGATGSFFVEG
jgi:hypothetical protein